MKNLLDNKNIAVLIKDEDVKKILCFFGTQLSELRAKRYTGKVCLVVNMSNGDMSNKIHCNLYETLEV